MNEKRTDDDTRMTIFASHIRRLLTLTAAVLVAWAMHAQPDASLSHFWVSPTYYNPASAGSLDAIHLTLGSRLQWVDIKNAPMNFMVMGDMPFRFMEQRWGVGARVEAERIGLYTSTRVGAQLAWKRKMLRGTLSVGIQPGIISQTFRGEEVIIPDDDAHDSSDEAIPKQAVSGTVFDASAGIAFTRPRWWVSASVTHLTAPSILLRVNRDAQDYYEFNVSRGYYLMGGCNIPIKNTLFELQPAAMVGTDFNAWTMQANLRVRYNRFLSAGVGYRHNDAATAYIGVNLKDAYIGYAYDYPISAISKVTYGSHEVFITYNVKLDMKEKNRNKQKSIRLM